MALTPQTCSFIKELSYWWAGLSSWNSLNERHENQVIYNAGLTVSGIYVASSASTYAVSRMPSFQIALGRAKHRYLTSAMVASNLFYTMGINAYCSRK